MVRKIHWLVGTNVVTLFLFCCVMPALGEPSNSLPKLKLVVQITVDQLRGDTLTRFGDRFGPAGFRYLLEKGTHFTNAHYKQRSSCALRAFATSSEARPRARAATRSDLGNGAVPPMITAFFSQSGATLKR